MNARVKAEFDILAAAMDQREEPLRLIKEYEDAHGFVPPPYCHDIKMMSSYADYKRCGPWRKQWAVVRTVKATARLAAKNRQRANKSEAQ